MAVLEPNKDHKAVTKRQQKSDKRISSKWEGKNLWRERRESSRKAEKGKKPKIGEASKQKSSSRNLKVKKKQIDQISKSGKIKTK